MQARQTRIWPALDFPEIAAINLHIVVHLLGQLSKETIHKKTSTCWVILALTSTVRFELLGYESCECVIANCYGVRASFSKSLSLLSYVISGSLTVEMSALSVGRVRTWHFTSILAPTHEINGDFFQLCLPHWYANRKYRKLLDWCGGILD